MTATGAVSAAPRRARHRGKPKPPSNTTVTAVRGVGEVLITLGGVLLLFCVYQLFYTNVGANRAMAKEKEQLQQQWQQVPPVPVSDDGGAKPKPAKKRAFSPGQGFAILYIPRLGDDYSKPILEGVALKDLARGIGHYPKSVMPGEVGNFAIAGHRATHGEPFANLPKVRRGDSVIVETVDSWYVYEVDREKITTPSDVAVVAPVPEKPGVRATRKLITLTTCHPRWASYQRFIVFGHLEKRILKSSGQTPAELSTA
jgi:sortase A